MSKQGKRIKDDLTIAARLDTLTQWVQKLSKEVDELRKGARLPVFEKTEIRPPYPEHVEIGPYGFEVSRLEAVIPQTEPVRRSVVLDDLAKVFKRLSKKKAVMISWNNNDNSLVPDNDRSLYSNRLATYVHGLAGKYYLWVYAPRSETSAYLISSEFEFEHCHLLHLDTE